MLSFCPWNLSALDRNSNLKSWLSSWLGDEAEFLSPTDWFIRGHDISGVNLLLLQNGRMDQTNQNFGDMLTNLAYSFGLLHLLLLMYVMRKFVKHESSVKSQHMLL